MLTDLQKYCHELRAREPRNEKELKRLRRQLAKKYKTGMPSNAEILKILKKSGLEPSDKLWQLLIKRNVRTIAGVAPVAVLTKPYECPGNCAYCPTQEDVPQSYLKNEPAVMRAIRCGYDPQTQVRDRIRALINNGHQPEKIELIVIGGTWSYFDDKYKYWYILNCFAAANDYGKKQSSLLSPEAPLTKLRQKLKNEQKRNESATHRIIGITLETRPDYINDKELWQMRELGATRVEIGVQAIDDKILGLNRRGSTVADIKQATKSLKNFGFKATYHFMPALPGSTPDKDIQMYKDMFAKPQKIKADNFDYKDNTYLPDNPFSPDQIKFYPTVVTQGSLLYKWYKQGKYRPYSDTELKRVIIESKKATPEYVRIIRLIRDIPEESIIAGNKVTNLRQVMQQQGAQCRCIRCRQAEKSPQGKPLLFISSYRSAGGRDFFISFEDKKEKILYGFCRLRLPDENIIFKQPAALIRELHVYGSLTPVKDKHGMVQHRGLGKQLLKQAEDIALQADFEKMAIISGIGVRGYYRKLGYRLQKTYMAKNLRK